MDIESKLDLDQFKTRCVASAARGLPIKTKEASSVGSWELLSFLLHNHVENLSDVTEAEVFMDEMFYSHYVQFC